jgi:hypothetical protein
MILKLKKEFYRDAGDYAVKPERGEAIMKIASLPGGYYAYNKAGEQIGQVSFGGGFAQVSIGRKKGGSAALSVVNDGGKLKFLPYEAEKEDLRYLEGIEPGPAVKTTIWGDPKNYNYDLYEGNAKVASFVPSTTDPDFYLLKWGESGNILKIILISLAVEGLLSIS